MKKVLLVCTGNLCRSPMAQGILRHLLKSGGLANELQVASAGVAALEGEPATPLAVEVLSRKGIDISGHRSHKVTPHDIKTADLVLVMTQAHRDALAELYPEQKSKVYLLSQLAGESWDIADPMGNPDPSAYEKTADEIQAYIRRGWPRLIKISGIEKDR